MFKNGVTGTVVASISDPFRDFERFSATPLNWEDDFGISCEKIAYPRDVKERDVKEVQVQFANEVSGANGNALIPVNGEAVELGVAYANTNLEVAGTLFVTSLQFTADFQGVACDVLKDGSKVVAHIEDPGMDFQKFAVKPVDWQTGFTISCY